MAVLAARQGQLGRLSEWEERVTIGQLRERLRWSLIPAVPVPRNVDGSLHRDAQEAYVRWMAGQPVGGVAVWAHTGRGLLLSRKMRQEVLRCWRAGVSSTRLLIAGAGAPPEDPDYLRTAIRMAEDAAEAGADALLCYAPTAYRTEPDRILEYHRALAGVGLPLLLFFLYEAAGGVTYSLETLRELLALPGVAGIKMATLDSVMTYQEVSCLIQEEFPETVLVTGEDRFLGYSMLAGAQGALIGMGAALPALQAELVSAPPESHPSRFLELTRATDRYSQATFRVPLDGYVQRMLWALADTGVIPEEAAYDPDGPLLPDWERAAVRSATLAFASAR